MDDTGKYIQWLAEASLGQNGFPGEMGLQLGLERWTEGLWRDIYMGAMESYKGKQAACVSEGPIWVVAEDVPPGRTMVGRAFSLKAVCVYRGGECQ